MKNMHVTIGKILKNRFKNETAVRLGKKISQKRIETYDLVFREIITQIHYKYDANLKDRNDGKIPSEKTL